MFNLYNVFSSGSLNSEFCPSLFRATHSTNRSLRRFESIYAREVRSMPQAPWDLAKAKRVKRAVKAMAHARGGFFYPLTALESQSGDCPEGLREYICSNFNSLKTFASVVRLPLEGAKRVPNSQFPWEDQQISYILLEVSKVEETEFLPTNACLRERGLRWVEIFISGRSDTFSDLTGLKRSTFSQRAARRDRSTYHKTWTLPDAIKTTRELAAKLQTNGFMPTQKQFRENRLNWLSSLVSQKFGGIAQFATDCGLRLRRMSQGRRLRKPRHLLRRSGRVRGKGIKLFDKQFRPYPPVRAMSPAEQALHEISTPAGTSRLPPKHKRGYELAPTRKRPLHYEQLYWPVANKRVKLEPKWG